MLSFTPTLEDSKRPGRRDIVLEFVCRSCLCSVSSCSAFMIEDQGATLLTDIILRTKFRWRHPGMLVLHELFLLG